MPLLQSCHSSIGKKVLMAVTGLMLFGFVLGHLVGNLLIFLGPEALNAYALKLRHLGPVLWVARITLLAAFLLHIGTAICLTIENRRARPIPYARKATIETTYAARTMMVSGLLVLVYIIYHLMHFTFRVTNPDISHATDALGHHDVYSMVVLSFRELPISAVYMVSMLILCMHLKHGLASMLQTVGLNNDRTLVLAERISIVASVLIFAAYSSIPFAVLIGKITTGGVS